MWLNKLSEGPALFVIAFAFAGCFLFQGHVEIAKEFGTMIMGALFLYIQQRNKSGAEDEEADG